MKKPNILFVFADQLRYHALGSSGNCVVKTPNLDKLANQGIVFEKAFSNCPICAPYRAQILTGRYSHQNGVVDNEYKMRTDIETLSQSLKKSGYHTGYIGKWHLGYGPYTEDKRYGFDYMAAYNCIDAYYEVPYYENEKGPYMMNKWTPIEETSLAIRFMEDHLKKDDESPFALMMSWGPPHWPYDQYPEEYKIYDPEKVDIRPNVPVQMETFARKEIADYYGNITAFDAQIGRLMDSLKHLGIEKETIFCFTSDHGDHLSSHGYAKEGDSWMHHTMRASKATPYDESIHIPFILRYPNGFKGGLRTGILFSSVDVMPTLLSLCGLEIPQGVYGKDLAHAVTGEEGYKPDSVYLQILGPGWPARGKWVGFWRGIRTERWLYARWVNNECGPFLFDLEKDPYEKNNLYFNMRSKDIIEGLEARLKAWMEYTQDPFDTGERDENGMLVLGQEFISDRYK